MCKVSIQLKKTVGVHNTKLLVVCTQTDTRMDTRKDVRIHGQTDLFQYTPKNIRSAGV